MGQLDGPAPGAPPTGPDPERRLPIIPLDDGIANAADGRVFTLLAQRGSMQILSGLTTHTWGYNGALLGPALRLRTGEQATVRVHNDLGEPTTVHWHGLVVPADMDGGPHQSIPAGGDWQARFTVVNPASTYWYQPPVRGSTSRQVALGLAALLIVDDPAVAEHTLPDTWGVDDLALVLH